LEGNFLLEVLFVGEGLPLAAKEAFFASPSSGDTPQRPGQGSASPPVRLGTAGVLLCFTRITMLSALLQAPTFYCFCPSNIRASGQGSIAVLIAIGPPPPAKGGLRHANRASGII